MTVSTRISEHVKNFADGNFSIYHHWHLNRGDTFYIFTTKATNGPAFQHTKTFKRRQFQ